MRGGEPPLHCLQGCALCAWVARTVCTQSSGSGSWGAGTIQTRAWQACRGSLQQRQWYAVLLSHGLGCTLLAAFLWGSGRQSDKQRGR